ncbi:MAG: LysR substrate-binding domain-containing protein [Burkholderiaceae bacterium]
MTHIDRALRSNIKLRHLQLIAALDEFRHLGRTADFLLVSQPAISKMLMEIESMLGLQLFIRSTRGTEPTVAGTSLVRFARSVLAQYERTRDEIAAVASGVAGRTRVGTMSGALPVLLSRGIEILKESSAHASVLVEEGDLTHLLPKLRVNELDFFVGRLEPGYAAPDLLTEPLYREPMVAIVDSKSPLARKKQPSWHDFMDMPCVMPPPWASLRVKIEQEFYRHGLTPPKDLIETSSYFAITTFVRERRAIGFVARSVGLSLQDHGQCKVLALDIPIALPPVGIMTLRDQHLTSASEHLISALRVAAQELFPPTAESAAAAPPPSPAVNPAKTVSRKNRP